MSKKIVIGLAFIQAILAGFAVIFLSLEPKIVLWILISFNLAHAFYALFTLK